MVERDRSGREEAAISERASFDLIRYANCWEDAGILTDGLAIQPGDVCLSIASGGDNSLALLAFDPSLVVATDISSAQLALVDLKREAIASLDHEDFLAFLGFRSSNHRAGCYRSLRSGLAPQSRDYWDRHTTLIEGGVIHAGRFEHYFNLFRRRVLPLIHSRSDIESLLKVRSIEERHDFYRRRWDTWRWRLIFRIFFSRRVMGRMGRDPEFFRYVEGSVADRILQRVEHALTVLPGHDNPYMTYILTGNFGDALPMYARHDCFERIRNNIQRLRLDQATAESAASRHGVRFDACNLSDIFEYMNLDQFREVGASIVSGCNRGARLAYWNMMVPRRIHDISPEATEYLADRSQELLARDRAFFYQAFHLERVL